MVTQFRSSVLTGAWYPLDPISEEDHLDDLAKAIA